MTQANHAGSFFSFVYAFAFFQPTDRNQSGSAFGEVVVGTNDNLVVLITCCFLAIHFSFEAVSVRNARRYVAETVSGSSGNLSLLVFFTLFADTNSVIFSSFILTGNRNVQVIGIVTGNYAVYLVILNRIGICSTYCNTFCISVQISIFGKRACVLTEETGIFVFQTGVVRLTAGLRMFVFIHIIRIIARNVLYAAAEACKYGRVVAYGDFTAFYTTDSTQSQYIFGVRTRFPCIDVVAAVFQYGVQITGADGTEVAFQADEGLAVTPAAVSAGDGGFLFQLPNGFHAVAEVFLTFETDFRTEVGNLGCSFRFSALSFICTSIFYARNFYACFNCTVQGNVSHCCNRQGSQCQGNQGFFHCCIPFHS
ncbi:hypothetical protein NM90_2239 [Neisseria meningitidis NM90]|nr:hypothetical protein NM90_2239 [Neisseria meningitidis NM90]EOC67995.1 hypothetical protein NM3144_2156 [Neisseria meningitidis NM3144]